MNRRYGAVECVVQSIECVVQSVFRKHSSYWRLLFDLPEAYWRLLFDLPEAYWRLLFDLPEAYWRLLRLSYLKGHATQDTNIHNTSVYNKTLIFTRHICALL